MRVAAFAIVLAAGLVAAPAGACSCEDDAFVLPSGESVPTNARLFVRGACVDPKLFDEAGQEVELEAEPDLFGVIVRRPAAPLAPGSYQIECGPGASFVVGAEADQEPPPAPRPTSGPFVSGDGGCGVTDYRSYTIVTEEAALLLVDLEERNSPSPARHREALRVAGPTLETLVGRGSCRTNWDFEAHGQPYVRWASIDRAGNQSAFTPWDVAIDGCSMARARADMPAGACAIAVLAALGLLRRSRALRSRR